MIRRNARLAAVILSASLVLGVAGCTPVTGPGAPVGSGSPSSAAVTMPDLVGLNGKVARDKLGALGFGLGRVTFGSADPQASVVVLPENWTVTAQSVPAGTAVELGTRIVLTVVKTADVSTPTTVTMPNLVGLNGQVAADTLTGLGFSRLHITFGSADPNAKVVLVPANWKVTAQSVPPGSQVSIASSVVLTAVKLSD